MTKLQPCEDERSLSMPGFQQNEGKGLLGEMRTCRVWLVVDTPHKVLYMKRVSISSYLEAVGCLNVSAQRL